MDTFESNPNGTMSQNCTTLLEATMGWREQGYESGAAAGAEDPGSAVATVPF